MNFISPFGHHNLGQELLQTWTLTLRPIGPTFTYETLGQLSKVRVVHANTIYPDVVWHVLGNQSEIGNEFSFLPSDYFK